MGNSDNLRRRPNGLQKLLFALQSPVTTPERKGVIYTRGWVVELLLNLAGYNAIENLVDAVAVEPAAGDGAFLGPMIDRLVASSRRLGRPLSDCHDSLIAYELNVASANRTRALAVRRLVNSGVDHSSAVCLAGRWIRTGDYLLEASSFEADFVIGNPPYVRLEDIPEETAAVYRGTYSTMRGRADLYVAFFEAALWQLKTSGVCAFICADRWMRNQYGADLRELVTSAYSVDLVLEMHNADAFDEDVDAYPAITVIRHKVQGNAVVASAGLDAVKTNPEILAAKLQATARRETQALPDGLRTAVVENWFRGADPWPCNSPEQLALLRRLEDKFFVLESCAKVGIGVATGNDGVFITKNADLVESSRMLKLALGRDIGGGKLEWSGHYLVDPWDHNGLVDLGHYPRLKIYLETHAEALRKRHTARLSKSGWYKTIDRVTHALTAKPKLYISDIGNTLAPVLDRGETYPHHNLYFIESGTWNLEVLGGLLMSDIGQFFVASYGVRMRGGYWRFQAQYLRRIRLPDPATIPEPQAVDLVQAFRQRDRGQATVTALRLYGVTQREWEVATGSR